MDKFFDFLYKIIDDIKEKRLSFSIVSLSVFIVTFLICQKIEASSFLTAIATCGLVWVSIQQIKIQRSQNNLALFEKRWSFWEETKRLGNKAQTFKHIPVSEMGDNTDPEKNFWIVGQEIRSLAKKSGVLFGKAFETEINEIAITFEEMHMHEEKILWKKAERDEKEKQKQVTWNSEPLDLRKENQDIGNMMLERMKLFTSHTKKWDNLAQHIFNKIRELEV